MADLNKFSDDIVSFRLGNLKYEYNFNSAGNLFFKEEPTNLNESFFKVVVRNSEYDYGKFVKFYNLSFEEFSSSGTVPSSDEYSNSKSGKSTTNTSTVTSATEYKDQLNSLQSQISSSSASTTSDSVHKLRSELKANRDIIVELRMAAGNGVAKEDFSEIFPFYLKKDATISNK